MNTDSLTLQRFKRMDRKTQNQVMDFTAYLLSRPYNEIERCVSEEFYEKNKADKRKELKMFKKFLKPIKN